LCFVEDIARANLLVATNDRLDGQAINVGGGKATSISELARLISGALDIHIEPVVRGEFRPGEMRHLISDITRIRGVGFAPHVDLETGIERYLNWIRAQADVRDYFAAAETGLRSKGIIQSTVRAARA
jgi:dTDP-L-rhamnose 4-epimerase